jgi:hypothetical protein
MSDRPVPSLPEPDRQAAPVSQAARDRSVVTPTPVAADPGAARHRILAAVAATALSVGAAQIPAAHAQEPRKEPDAAAANDVLLKKMEQMEQRIRTLEGQLRQKNAKDVAQARGQTAAAADAKSGDAKSADAKPGDAKSADAKPGKDAGPMKQAKAPDDAPAAGRPDWATPAARDVSGKTAPVNAPNSILGMIDSPVSGLSIGTYGEIKFGMMQNPAAGGQWQNGFDAHRVVLLPTYAITPNIIFNAEIEFEHSGSGFDADDKLHGTAEIEQVWVDFKIADMFNWRSPGIDLIPIGYINEHHEPTQFYSVNRPELYNGLIPSTWKAGATSVYGRLAEGLTYTVQASTSLEDFGSDFGTRTDAKTVPAGGYAAGINGLDALSFSLPVRGDFAQLSNDIAVAGKLAYSPPVLPGFNGSLSAYYTPNTTPRGAYAGVDGAALGRSSLTMFDAEFRYRAPDTGWEARGEYVFVAFGNPANLRANNDGDPANNVGKTMYGYSGELAYHLPLGNYISSDWEAVPFYRYTFQNTQTGGVAGADVTAGLNTPAGAGQTQYHSAGIAVFPSPKVALKATYQKVINNAPGGANSDSFLGGVGFFF